MAEAYIAVGSNISPYEHVVSAVEFLSNSVEIRAISTWYWSAALERPEQPEFLNGVIRIGTTLTPHALKFDVLRPIEEQLGRKRVNDRFAPRTIDLDLIAYNNMVLDEPGLHIPDPEIMARPFLAIPLAELAPDFVMPGSGIRISECCALMESGGLRPDWAFTKQMRKRFC